MQIPTYNWQSPKISSFLPSNFTLLRQLLPIQQNAPRFPASGNFLCHNLSAEESLNVVKDTVAHSSLGIWFPRCYPGWWRKLQRQESTKGWTQHSPWLYNTRIPEERQTSYAEHFSAPPSHNFCFTR